VPENGGSSRVLHVLAMPSSSEREQAERDLKAAEYEFLEMLNALRWLHGEEPLSELPAPPFCNFCGRSKAEVQAMVEGLDAHICDACVSEAQRLFRKG
jgi:hypothetical protein